MANKIAWFTSHGRREAFNPTLDPPSFMPSSRKTGSYRGWLEAVAPREFHMPAPRDCALYPAGSCYSGVPGDLGRTKGQRVSARKQLWAALWEAH